MTFLRRPSRTLIVAILALSIGVGVYAYAATNTVPEWHCRRRLGHDQRLHGEQHRVHAQLDDADEPRSVAFTISPAAATTVKAQLASGGSWYSCTNTAGSVICNTTSPQATVAAATQLTVVAAQ